MIATVAAATNTGAATINADGKGVANIKRSDLSALQQGDIVAGRALVLQYDSTGVAFRIIWSPADNKAQVHTGTDTGTPNAIVATMSPPVYLYETGALYIVKIGTGNSNTGVATANLGPGVKTIKAIDGTDLIGGEFLAGRMLIIDYDGTNLQMLNGITAAPKFLSAPRTYFVNASTGSDANNGLASGTAFATIGRAVTSVTSFNMNGFGITVNVANGAYGPFVCPPLNGSGSVAIVGNNATPASVVVTAATGEAINVYGNGWTISGMKVISSANGAAPNLGCGVRASGALCVIYNMEFGSAAFAHVLADGAGGVQFRGAANGFPTAFINITGSAPAFMQATSNSILGPGQTNLNITGTPAFASAFAVCTQNSSIVLPFGTITGSATGSRYSVSLNGVINTNGSGANYYPGNSAGVSSTGGQYL